MHLEAMRLFAFSESLSLFLLKAISQSLRLLLLQGLQIGQKQWNSR